MRQAAKTCPARGLSSTWPSGPRPGRLEPAAGHAAARPPRPGPGATRGASSWVSVGGRLGLAGPSPAAWTVVLPLTLVVTRCLG
jgi:hypothetical protein